MPGGPEIPPLPIYVLESSERNTHHTPGILNLLPLRFSHRSLPSSHFSLSFLYRFTVPSSPPEMSCWCPPSSPPSTHTVRTLPSWPRSSAASSKGMSESIVASCFSMGMGVGMGGKVGVEGNARCLAGETDENKTPTGPHA